MVTPTVSHPSRAYAAPVSSIRERIVEWFKRQRAYQPPPGRLAEDTTQRLPSGGDIQRMPGDGADPAGLGPQAGRNP